MKAITTKYHGATDTRGSRVSAADQDGNRVSLSWDDALNSGENHDAAVRALCIKMDWTQQPLVSGSTKTGNVYVFMNGDALRFTEAEKQEAHARRQKRIAIAS